MPNDLSSAGLQVKTLQEVTDDLTTGMQGIYGTDINVSSNSPDGQLLGIFAQACADALEVLLDVYNTFTVEGAYGVVLDQRVALNGLTRRAGTYTETPVLVTVDRALTLVGLDDFEADPTVQVFTVADDAGNQFYLAEGEVFGAAGSASLTFRAVAIGQVEVTANTITNQVTTVLGVTAINNPTTAGTNLGVNEETDSQLRVRHGRMFYLAATGPADSVEAALLALEGMVDAAVFENDTDGTVDTMVEHSIWAIVRGGDDEDIAQAIYSKKAPGCAMNGAVTENVTRPNGTIFTAQWDVAVAQDLYIQFGIIPRVEGETFDEPNLKILLAQALANYRINQIATIGDVVQAMAIIAPNAILTDVGVSDDGITYEDTLEPTDMKNYFTVDTANIDIL